MVSLLNFVLYAVYEPGNIEACQVQHGISSFPKVIVPLSLKDGKRGGG